MRSTIEMAREVGFTVGLGSPALEKFERLIAMARADEREACAKVCGELVNEENSDDYRNAADWCATRIRARGKTK